MAREGHETRLSRKCKKKALSLYGSRLVLVKYHGDNMTEAGVSDFIGTIDGRFLAIEMKAPQTYGNSVTRAVRRGPTIKQRAFLMRVRASGGVWSVCASEDQFLETLGAGVNHTPGTEFPPMPWLDLRDFPTDDSGLCTCDPRYGCEAETDHGCAYCRTADPELPCPNID